MRFLGFFCLACLTCGMLHACASTSNGISSERMAALDQMQNSVEYVALDAEIGVIADETDKIRQAYDRVEQQVLGQLNFKNDERTNDAPIHALVTSNNVLLVDGNAMSRHDFSIFAAKNLPDRCQIAPELQINGNADFETASWVLETFYANGCMDVKIVDSVGR